MFIIFVYKCSKLVQNFPPLVNFTKNVQNFVQNVQNFVENLFKTLQI